MIAQTREFGSWWPERQTVVFEHVPRFFFIHFNVLSAFVDSLFL